MNDTCSAGSTSAKPKSIEASVEMDSRPSQTSSTPSPTSTAGSASARRGSVEAMNVATSVIGSLNCLRDSCIGIFSSTHPSAGGGTSESIWRNECTCATSIFTSAGFLAVTSMLALHAASLLTTCVSLCMATSFASVAAHSLLSLPTAWVCVRRSWRTPSASIPAVSTLAARDAPAPIPCSCCGEACIIASTCSSGQNGWPRAKKASIVSSYSVSKAALESGKTRVSCSAFSCCWVYLASRGFLSTGVFPLGGGMTEYASEALLPLSGAKATKCTAPSAARMACQTSFQATVCARLCSLSQLFLLSSGTFCSLAGNGVSAAFACSVSRHARLAAHSSTLLERGVGGGTCASAGSATSV
mmetsp:Transcript_41921/g.96188  ORF Transcript_41921/g.96188 Transcript_41921/m.96188 type:complete len:358 (-) Transcript_41921:1075-2148(-)